jgi:hypothetical protein
MLARSVSISYRAGGHEALRRFLEAVSDVQLAVVVDHGHREYREDIQNHHLQFPLPHNLVTCLLPMLHHAASWKSTVNPVESVFKIVHEWNHSNAGCCCTSAWPTKAEVIRADSCKSPAASSDAMTVMESDVIGRPSKYGAD